MKVLFLSIVLLFPVSVSAQETIREFVNRQMWFFKQSRLLDIYKSCFQDYMGAEHLVADRQTAKAYLDEELNTTSIDDLMLWYSEPCGYEGNYVRVNILTIKREIISADQLLDAFIRSANAETRHSIESWKDRWHMIIGTIDQMKLDLPNYEKDKQYIDSLLSVGKYAISHSPEYREAYHPHYRIVERSIFEKEIEPLIEEKRPKGVLTIPLMDHVRLPDAGHRP